MKNVVVKDVCEVFLEDNATGKIYFLGVTSTNNVNQSIDQSPINGGIGNKRITTISSNKSLSFDVTTTLHDDDVYELQSGSLFGTEAIQILKQETAKAVDSSGSITVPITGTPVGDVTVIDKHGKEINGTFATGKVTISSGVEGETYTVIYNQAEAAANVLDLNSEVMPKSYKTQLHTIAYDPDTEKVVADLYWVFSKARPDGNMQVGYTAGENQSDSITFNCETPIGETSFGKYAVVARA